MLRSAFGTFASKYNEPPFCAYFPLFFSDKKLPPPKTNYDLKEVTIQSYSHFFLVVHLLNIIGCTCLQIMKLCCFSTVRKSEKKLFLVLVRFSNHATCLCIQTKII